MAKAEKKKNDNTPWCAGKKVLRQLVRLELDIKSNEKDSERRRKKIKYIQELSQFVKLIDFSRGENVKFRFSGNASMMGRAMPEMNFIFGEQKVQVEQCSLVPKKYEDKICVLKVDGQTLVLIELE